MDDLLQEIVLPIMETPEPFGGDLGASWVYWTNIDTAENGVPIDFIWERLRSRRDQLLMQTDFRMVTDAPWDINPWIEYRQALRDLPKNTTDPTQAAWPSIPGGQ